MKTYGAKWVFRLPPIWPSRPNKYPFHLMKKIGDSFLITGAVDEKTRGNLNSLRCYYQKVYGIKVSMKIVGGCGVLMTRKA